MQDALEIFGRTLTLIRRERDIDINGKLKGITTTQTTFLGDLQYGEKLSRNLVEAGYVTQGGAVLYIKATSPDPLPNLGDVITDGKNVWRVSRVIEGPELGPDTVFYSYGCERSQTGNDYSS